MPIGIRQRVAHRLPPVLDRSHEVRTSSLGLIWTRDAGHATAAYIQPSECQGSTHRCQAAACARTV